MELIVMHEDLMYAFTPFLEDNQDKRGFEPHQHLPLIQFLKIFHRCKFVVEFGYVDIIHIENFETYI